MKRKLLPFRDEIREKFKDVVYAIEATNYEETYLWDKNSQSNTLNWKEYLEGYVYVIGHIEDLPVAVGISFAGLNGHKVVFYEATSVIVDHEMVRKWIDHYNPIPHNHTNAQNFLQCLSVVGVPKENPI